MADEFDCFLSESLAPPERDPDRRFVAQVQARIALDERLRTERWTVLRRLALQMLALAAVAAGLVWLGRSPEIAQFVAESPAAALAALLAAFTFLVILLTAPSGEVELA